MINNAKQEERRGIFKEKLKSGKKGYGIFILEKEGNENKCRHIQDGQIDQITGKAKLLYQNRVYSFDVNNDDSFYLSIRENSKNRFLIDFACQQLQSAFDLGFKADNSNDFMMIFYAKDFCQEYLWYFDGFDNNHSCIQMYDIDDENSLYNFYRLMEEGIKKKVKNHTQAELDRR